MMSSQLRRRLILLCAVLLVSALALAACAPNPNELIISPQLGEQMVARAAGNQVVRAEPTPLPKLADLPPEQVTAGLDEEVLAALAGADVARGQQLATQNACIGCHSLDPDATMTGPTWYNIGNTAVSRIPGMSPAAYLDHSIISPSEYVVPGFLDNLMPHTYADLLSAQDQADLIAYLLSQTAE